MLRTNTDPSQVRQHAAHPLDVVSHGRHASANHLSHDLHGRADDYHGPCWRCNDQWLQMGYVVCWSVSATRLTTSGFFAFGCAALLVVLWNLLFQGRKYARHLGSDISRAYILPTVILILSWICYPIAWGVSDGGNIIAPVSNSRHALACLSFWCADVPRPDFRGRLLRSVRHCRQAFLLHRSTVLAPQHRPSSHGTQVQGLR